MSEQDRKVAIITGGSQGIGAGLVAGYRRRGWAVVANARTIKPAGDPAEMQAILTSLPLDPWMTDETTPLTPHPSNPALTLS